MVVPFPPLEKAKAKVWMMPEIATPTSKPASRM